MEEEDTKEGSRGSKSSTGAKFHSMDHRIDHARERSNGMFSQ